MKTLMVALRSAGQAYAGRNAASNGWFQVEKDGCRCAWNQRIFNPPKNVDAINRYGRLLQGIFK
jgi:hypothetical protein